MVDLRVPADIAVWFLETGFYKGLSVSISVLDGKKVLYLQVYGMGLSNPGHT